MMQEPLFTQTMQIGIVVRDLDATMWKYADEYGIGPWKVYDFKRQDLREWGQAVQRSWRVAVAMVGHLQWELIEPRDDESIYARFLAEKGGGACTTSPSLPRASRKCWQWRPNGGLMWSSAASSKASGPHISARIAISE